MQKFLILLVVYFAVGYFATAQRASDSPVSEPPGLDIVSSGNNFLMICEPAPEPPEVIRAFCKGYVNGVIDGANRLVSGGFYCSRTGVNFGQQYRVVVKFLKDHPEKTDRETGALILQAIALAFPCDKDKK